MAYNMYKQISKIRESLETKEYKKDIPLEIFGRELMLMFGMRKKKAIEWIYIFEDVNLIKIENECINYL